MGPLDLIPNYYPHYPEPPRDRLRRRMYRLRGILLTALPAALMFASLYCGVQYIRRLNQSVTLAAQEVAHVTSARAADPSATRAVLWGEHALYRAGSALTQRAVLLQGTRREDIPLFGELAALYIGIFAAAVLAVTILALKEYAKGRMGLAEQEVFLGRFAAR